MVSLSPSQSVFKLTNSNYLKKLFFMVKTLNNILFNQHRNHKNQKTT